MKKFIFKRIGFLFISIWVVITITFVLTEFLPSPFLSEKCTEICVAEQEHIYGFDKPFLSRYFSYLFNLLKFDLGTQYGKATYDITKYLIKPMKVTVVMGLLALLLGSVVGIALGTLAAIYHGRWLDKFSTVIGVIGVSIPSFVLAGLLQKTFGYDLEWFPPLYSADEGFIGGLFTLILPIVSLSVFIMASTMRYMRSELIEVLSADYILLAKSTGLSSRKVMLGYAFRNALIPVITIIGPLFIVVLSGSTVIEQYFQAPGLAAILVYATKNGLSYIVMGIAIIYSLTFMVVMLIIDILYGVIDPRIRVAGGEDNG